MCVCVCVKVETVGDAVPAVEAILRRCNHLHLMQHYCVPEFSDSLEFLAHLARRTGRLKKGGREGGRERGRGREGGGECVFVPGGVPDTNAAARTVLQDWNT